MLRVLVSSTFRDLRDERIAVRKVIADLAAAGHSVTAVAMEDFGALPESPLSASEEFAQQADIVLLIVGRAYGSLPPDEHRSFTHAEWDVLRLYKIPCLAYLLEVDEAVLSPDAARFRKQVKDVLTTFSFQQIDDLTAKVRQDLERVAGQDGRLGRCDLNEPMAVFEPSFGR
jgi:hypothetical protein